MLNTKNVLKRVMKIKPMKFTRISSSNFSKASKNMCKKLIGVTVDFWVHWHTRMLQFIFVHVNNIHAHAHCFIRIRKSWKESVFYLQKWDIKLCKGAWKTDVQTECGNHLCDARNKRRRKWKFIICGPIYSAEQLLRFGGEIASL